MPSSLNTKGSKVSSTLPAAISALLEHGATPLETASPPWKRHLLALREDGQISPVAFDQTLRLIEDSPVIRGHLARFETDWLSERRVSQGNAAIQQALAAVCFGLDVRLRLLDVDFVLVPPGREMPSSSNRRPFHLSTTILTANTHETLRDDVTPSEPPGSAEAGLSLAAAEDGVASLNEQLSAQARPETLAENEAIENVTSDLFWLRLPRKRELEFAAALNGPIAVQRCRTVAEVTDTRRHPLGIAGLIGGLWQFCSGDSGGDYWIWGGTHRMSAREFTQNVPTVRCLNSMLESGDYGLRPVVDPTDRTTS